MKFLSKYHCNWTILLVIIFISSVIEHFPQSESCSDYTVAIYYNGHIIIINENIKSASAMAIKGNLFHAVGSDEETKS